MHAKKRERIKRFLKKILFFSSSVIEIVLIDFNNRINSSNKPKTSEKPNCT